MNTTLHPLSHGGPPRDQRTRNLWPGLIRWIQENTFVPEWLPKQLRHLGIGYVVAVLIELAAAGAILLLQSPLPSFDFDAIFPLAGVILTALAFGAGPSLFATFVSILLIDAVVLPPHLSWVITNPADGVGLVLYLVVGVSISLFAGQSERARRQAEKTTLSLAQVEARSRFDADRLRTVLDVLPSAVMITSNQGQLVEMNQATKTLWSGDIPLGTDITHYSKDNLFKAWCASTGQPLPPDDWTLARTLSSGKAVLNDEFEIETLDGQRRVVLNSAAPVRDETGAITGAVMSAQDITERRRLEREVTEHAQELEAIFETMTDGVFVYDAQGRITRLNSSGREIVGPEAPRLDHTIGACGGHRRPRDEEVHSRLLEQIPSARILHGELLTGARAVDIHFTTTDGRKLALSASGTPMRTAQGTITGAVVVTRDVTERRRLEREVIERARELEAIFEAMTDGIAFLDTQGWLLRTNQAFRTLHGVDQHSEFLALALNQRLAMLALADSQDQSLPVEARPVTRLLQGETLTGIDVTIKNLEGRKVVLNVSGAPIRDHLGQVSGCVEVFRDVTARHHLEQRTRETLGALVAMAEAMVQIRPTALSVEVRDEAAVGGTSAVVTDATLPQVAGRLAQLTRSVLGCRRVSIVELDAPTGQLHPVTEAGLPSELGQEWWASWSPAQTLEERFGATIAAALHAGEPALLDTRHLPERSWYTLFHAHSGRILPMRLGEELVGTLLVDYQEPNHDYSHDYSNEEENLLTETLARLGALVLERDRLLRGWAETHAKELALGETKAQMDTFLGIASHELRTPLTSLKLSLQLTERRLRKITESKNGAATGTDAALHETTEQITSTTHQMRRLERLVDDLVDVSRIQAGKLELRRDQTDLVAIVREAVREQQEAAPDRTIRLECPANLSAPVYADAGRVEQVVTNYLTNALKYSPASCPVDIGVDVEQEQQVRIWVRDRGPGLPLQEQQQIWERFHRARGVEVQSGTGVGLGLGLYISRMIVERHGGQAGVESSPGNGSTFWFTLPLGML